MNDDRQSTDQPADVVPAELDLAPAAWRPPLSLRIVAFGFILVGTLSVVEMFLILLVFRNTGLLLSVGLIQGALAWGLLVGWGLLRWRKSAREMAVALTWLALIFVPTWLLVVEFGFRNITKANPSLFQHEALFASGKNRRFLRQIEKRYVACEIPSRHTGETAGL